MIKTQKHKSSKTSTGALLMINRNGFIESIMIIANDDQDQAVVEGALARISKPAAWGWIRKILRK